MATEICPRLGLPHQYWPQGNCQYCGAFKLDSKAAMDMTQDEREAELARVEARIANGFGEHGGSPGEWWYERADELRHWMEKNPSPTQSEDTP